MCKRVWKCQALFPSLFLSLFLSFALSLFHLHSLQPCPWKTSAHSPSQTNFIIDTTTTPHTHPMHDNYTNICQFLLHLDAIQPFYSCLIRKANFDPSPFFPHLFGWIRCAMLWLGTRLVYWCTTPQLYRTESSLSATFDFNGLTPTPHTRSSRVAS